jgi:hypothetical protein
MYRGVPSSWAAQPGPIVSPPSTWAARPKSAIFSVPDVVSKRFAGLMSRWQMPNDPASLNASAASRIFSMLNCSGSRPPWSFAVCAVVIPWTYSMAMNR